MTTIVNAAGDDYTGLPTQPVQYRGARKHTGLPWNELTEQYLARGGQVDASVWPKTGGRVVIVGGNANSSRANMHTFVEADEYDEPNTQVTPKVRPPQNQPLLSDTDQRKVALRYRAGESIRALAAAFNVTTSAIQTALRHQGEPTRTTAEANRLRTRSAS